MNVARDPLQAITGDRAGALVLRRSLTALAEQDQGSPLARAIRDVLAGRRDLRDLAQDPEMAAIIADGMRAQERTWARLSDKEQARELAAGEAYLADLEEGSRPGA